MRVNSENQHLNKTSPAQLRATKKYISNLTEEQKLDKKEKARIYYLANRDKIIKQVKISYCKRNITNPKIKTIEEIQMKKDKQKQKLVNYLEQLLN